MRENTSAVPPCLTEKSAHLTQAPTRPKPANAGSASRNTHRSPCFPRALGGPFAGSLRSDFQPWPESLCVRRRFDLRLNGLAQCSTADALCQDWSCIFHALHVTQRSACPLPFLLPLRPQTPKEGDCLKSTMCRHVKSGVPFLCPPSFNKPLHSFPRAVPYTKRKTPAFARVSHVSKWRDSNSRPSGPEPDALPSCATPRNLSTLRAYVVSADKKSQ